MTSNEYTVPIGPTSLRALRAFLSNPVGALRVNGLITFEASENGGVLVRTGSVPQPTSHDARCTALGHHPDCPDWRLPF